MRKVGWSIDGNEISIENMPGRVKPCLMIRPNGENTIYKVASFNSERTAEWFMLRMLEILADEETQTAFRKAYNTMTETESLWLRRK